MASAATSRLVMIVGQSYHPDLSGVSKTNVAKENTLGTHFLLSLEEGGA